MTDKIALNIAEALNAVVVQETARLEQEFSESEAALVVRKQKLDRLFVALAEVERQVAGIDKVEVYVSPHRHMATVKVDGRRFSLSTDLANEKFTVEENYWSNATGDDVELFYSFDTDEEVLRLVLDAIGKYIALQKAIQERR